MKRSGSALLVVLGVLAFLVVSAVSFAAFMRRSRLPSSYLRRTVSSRQLAKAAVVRATDQIDRAIANGLHPGIGGTAENTWQDRVFFRGATPDPDSSTRGTAPVLSVEGLAYIPPPLVNEVRYWARKTPTAAWQAFGFDVGRYAYLAIDVSDYLDVNRLLADYPRSSAANRRITIAHLFEDANHTSPPSGADEWDKFMEKFRKLDDESLTIDFTDSSKVPLVSVADFNLALAEKGTVGGLRSPFAEYVRNGAFYNSGEGAVLEKYAQMTFVTDGWFPRPAQRAAAAGKKTDIYDLADGECQPFQMQMLKKNTIKFSGAALGTQMSGKAKDTWIQRLSGLGCAALADYLDQDRTPISLAVPTTERVPMICGIRPDLQGNPTFKLKADGIDAQPTIVKEDGNARVVEQTVSWKIDAVELKEAFMKGRVQALTVFPFLHKEEEEPTFEVDGQFSLFFSSPDIGLRTGGKDVLHLDKNTIDNSVVDAKNGVIRIRLPKCTPQMKTLSEGVAATEEDAVGDTGVSMMLSEGEMLATELGNAGKEFLKVKYTWQQTAKGEEVPGVAKTWEPSMKELIDDPEKWKSQVTSAEASCGLPALNSDGTVDADFTSGLSEKVKDPGWSKSIKLSAAVWLRVIDKKEGKIVDLVPACMADDKIQNNISDPDPRAQFVIEGEGGTRYPLMRFDTGITLDFGVKALSTYSGGQMTISPKAVMVADPRFNYAPEHWFMQDGEISPSEWVKCVRNNYLGGDHDGDIFLATSDAGYLQSLYELAFIPAFTDLQNYGTDPIAGDLDTLKNSGLKTFVAQGAESNRDFMWASYDPVGLDKDAFDNLPFTSEGSGLKINPYSNSTNIMMAALANTPVDWRRASSNAWDGATDYTGMKVGEFNKDYAWNGYNAAARLEWGDLMEISGAFMEDVTAKGNTGWKAAWNGLGWDWKSKTGPTKGEFLGIQLSDSSRMMWGADQKFLYGFWRDCFAVKQQLFLIFIRAEPLLMGGGASDDMPPQLGARAVALVWRDAEPPPSGAASNGYSHRTRLLFYRPLE